MADNVEAVEVAEAQRENNFGLAKENAEQRTLYVDDASHVTRFGDDIMLISPEGHKIHFVLCFGFKASNNKAEYEALIAGLHLSKELKARSIQIHSDSQLMVNQVNDIYLV